MELNVSPLKEEIDKILSEDSLKVFFEYTCYFRIRKPNNVDIKGANVGDYINPEEQDDIYRPLKITNIDFIRDYELNIGDEGSINLTISMGMWFKILQPYRDYLELVLTKKPLQERDLNYDKDEEAIIQVFACIPKVEPLSVGEASKYDKHKRVDLDSAGMVDIEFQLMDLSIEKVRSVTVGGIFRLTTPEKVVKGILAKESEKLNIADNGKAVENIKMVESKNQEEREHIMVPQGIKLSELSAYVHRSCGGIYSTGVNTYLQNKNWYVFPLFDTTRFDQEEKTLTVLKIPSMIYDEAERTWRKDGGRLICMATSESNFDDKGDQDFKDAGNGVRFADARQFMHKLVETKDNKAIAKRGKNNHEFLFKKMQIGDEQNNNVQNSVDSIHSNPFVEDSKLSRREGNFYTFLWKNSTDEEFYPGMPVKILYIKDDELKEIRGVLLKAHHAIMMQGVGMTAQTYRQQTVFYVYVDKNSVEAK